MLLNNYITLLSSVDNSAQKLQATEDSHALNQR